ncbi:MAG: MFS transporter, partial [Patescibacteria group bacterium]
AKRVNPLRFIIIGNTLFALSITFFTLTTHVFFALIFLFLAGLGLIMQFSTINSMIQHVVSDHIRGRVMSIYVLMFMGMLPIGSYLIGLLAENFGTSVAIEIGAGVVFVSGVYIYFYRKYIQQEYAIHAVV